MKNNKGQVMLLSIIILGGVMIGASTIGSFILRMQIQQINSASDATSAVFAADAGIEAVSWCFFNKSESTGECDVPTRGPDTFCPEDDMPAVDFEDDTLSVETTCRWDKRAGIVTVIAEGYKGDAKRILEATFSENNGN